MMKTIFVPINKNKISKRAIPVANAWARATSASVHIVHAVGENVPAPSYQTLVKQLDLRPEYFQNAIIEPLAGRPEIALPHLLSKNTGASIVLTMSSSENRPEDGIDTIVRSILVHTNAPTILVPPEREWDEWRPKKILLPQDSTAACAAAIAPLAPIADTYESVMTVLHIPFYATGKFSHERSALPFPRYLDQPQHEISAWQEEFLERLRSLGRLSEKTDLRLSVSLGEPADEIVNWSNSMNADLVVLPWTGRYGDANVLKSVIKHSSCPILALPLKEPSTIKAPIAA